MEWGVSFEVTLNELFEKDAPAKESSHTGLRVVLGGSMEDGLVLEIPQVKVGLSVREVFPHHLLIVVRDGVVQGQVAVVVLGVELWADLFDYACLACNADDVLDGMALVVLLPSGPVEVVGAAKPIEYLNVTLPCANKEHVLSQEILDHDGLGFPFLEDSEDIQVSPLARHEERGSALVVGMHAEIFIVLKYLLGDNCILLLAGNVEGSVTMDSVLRSQVKMLQESLVEELVEHVPPAVLHREEEGGLAVDVPQVQLFSDEFWVLYDFVENRLLIFNNGHVEN